MGPSLSLTPDTPAWKDKKIQTTRNFLLDPTPFQYILINSIFFNTVKNLRYSSIMVPSLYFTPDHSVYLSDLRKPTIFPLKCHFSDPKRWQRCALPKLKKYTFASFVFFFFRFFPSIGTKLTSKRPHPRVYSLWKFDRTNLINDKSDAKQKRLVFIPCLAWDTKLSTKHRKKKVTICIWNRILPTALTAVLNLLSRYYENKTRHLLRFSKNNKHRRVELRFSLKLSCLFFMLV